MLRVQKAAGVEWFISRFFAAPPMAQLARQLDDLRYDWDRAGQTQWVRQAMATGLSLPRAGQWSREFLQLGEALTAYEHVARDE